EARQSTAVDERAIAGGGDVRMKSLNRVDQDAGDVPASTQDPKRSVIHLAQRVGVAGHPRISKTGLYVVPPPVVRAREADEVRFTRVKSRKPYSLHHGLGAGHMERHLVESGNVPEAVDVLLNERMVGAKHRSELSHAFDPGVDAVFVKVVAENVD